MKFWIEQLPSTLAFSASNVAQQVIGAKPYYITGMLLDFEIAKTNSGTPAPTQDALMRVATSFSLQGDGKPYIKAAPDMRSLYWAQRLRMQGRHRVPDIGANSNTSVVTYHYQLPIVFSPNPIRSDGKLNWEDPTAAVKATPDLAMTLTWAAVGGATGALGTYTYIQTSTLLRTTLCGIQFEPGDPLPKYFPAWQATQYTPSATATGLSSTWDLPGGFLIRRNTILSLLGAAGSWADVRNDGTLGTSISEIGMRNYEGAVPVNMKFQDFVQRSQSSFQIADDDSANPTYNAYGTTYGVATTKVPYNAGVGAFDWTSLLKPGVADPTFGLNMLGKLSGIVKLGFTVDNTSTVNTQIFTESYLPY